MEVSNLECFRQRKENTQRLGEQTCSSSGSVWYVWVKPGLPWWVKPTNITGF